VFRAAVLKAFSAFAILASSYAGVAGAVAAECTNAQLKVDLKSAPSDPQRVPRLEKLLTCLGTRVDALAGAAAAYELALHFAGANKDVAPNYRRAVQWAKRSVAYLQPTNNVQLLIEAELAVLQLEYYGADDTSDLRKTADALASFSEVRCRLSRNQTTCAQAYDLLGKAERDLTDRGEEGARIRAITAFKSFLNTDLGKQRGIERASALSDLGTLQAMVPSGQLGQEDVQTAASALREAGTIFHEAGELGRERLAHVNLGALLGTHMAASASALTEAETLLRPLASATEASFDPAVQQTAIRNLGSVLFQKQTGNRIKNLEEAIDYLRAAHAAVSRSAPELWAKTADNLAIALEASTVRSVDRLREARGLLTEALQLVERHAAPAAGVGPLTTLISVEIHLLWPSGTASASSWFTEGFDTRDLKEAQAGEDEDIEAIGRLLERAKALTGQDRFYQAQIAALEADYMTATSAEDSTGALDAVVQKLRSALDSVKPAQQPALWATLQNNLGNRCNNRRRPDLAGCAVAAYQQALVVRTPDAMPREHVDTIVNLASLRFNQSDWKDAAELYLQAAAASRDAFDPTLGRELQLQDAGRSGRWFERVAFALAKMGRAAEAITIADNGRLRVLKELVKGTQVPSLAVSAVEQLPEVLPRETLVLMPIVTSAGTVVFVAGWHDDAVVWRQVFLDKLGGDEVAPFLNSQWLARYNEIFNKATRSVDAAAQWNPTLATAATWMGSSLLGPVIASPELKELWPPKSIVLVVQGQLALLPLHIAQLPDGKRLIDIAEISYLPSLSLWHTASRWSSTHALVSVPDPSQSQDLAYAHLEAAFDERVAGRALTPPIRRDQVLDALAVADIFHFVGHARFDPDDPDSSGMRLAAGDKLTVREIVEARLVHAPQLVILSACETGRAEAVTMANEFVGLPAAFMSIGAKGVIASLWPASDAPTFFLMVRLIEELQVNSKKPTAALRDAQLWLSQRKGLELAQLLRTFDPQPGTRAAVLEQALRVNYRNVAPYSDPWAWAGFFYSGLDP
jgi:CHAT domain-containing protein/tetratricopeptide (TPR) repeat protein